VDPRPGAGASPHGPPRGTRALELWFKKYQEDRCSLLAAAVAYRALFSIIPITALMVAGASQLLHLPDIRRQVVNGVVERIPIGRGLVIDSLNAISDSREPLTFLGIILLLWAAKGLFSTVRETLNVVWNVPARSFVGQNLVDLAGVLGLGTLVLVSVSGTATLHTIRNVGVQWLGDPDPGTSWVLEPATAVLTAAVSFGAFLLAYRFVPHVDHGFRDVVPGALLATVLFETGKHAFAWYLSSFSNHEVYGALGTVMVFQLWVYFSANILLAGAEVNAIRRGVLPASLRTRVERLDDNEVLRAAEERGATAKGERVSVTEPGASAKS
jgi:membrane protein